MSSITTASIAGVRPTMAIEFLQRIGAPEWTLQAGIDQRTFKAAEPKKAADWIIARQRAGETVFAIMPTLAGGHWWLQGRMPLTGSPAALKTRPTIITMDDGFTCLLRLAEPVTTARATQLASQVFGTLGRVATGEPVALPGTILSKRVGVGLLRRYPVRVMSYASSPGYRIVGETLVSVTAAPPAPVVRRAPGVLSVPLADGQSWHPGEEQNGFLLALGSSGSGKTYALRTIAAPIHAHGIPLVVLDFHGDVKVDGVPVVRVSSEAADAIGINPLMPDASMPLYDFKMSVAEMIARAVPTLGPLQRNKLADALDAAFASNQAPTFSDLLALLENAGLIAGVRGLFGHPIFNKPRNITIGERSLRIDLSKLTGEVRYIAAETLLQRIYTTLRMRGPIPDHPANDGERFRMFVVVDEALIITGRKSDIISSMFRESRKFGLGMILAAQSAAHFDDDVKGQAASWLVLKPQTLKEAKENAPNIGVEADALMQLRPKGDGYFRTGSGAAARIQVRRAA